MNPDFQTILCVAFTGNVDALSLHTGAPGTTGANEDTAVAREALLWSAPVDGISSAQVIIEDVAGEYTHIGLWDGAVFRMGVECLIKRTAPASLAILVTHQIMEGPAQ